MIHAPYNFVPLSEKVYFPNWADVISQDIPFSDGEDGEIEISIENLSPLFVRDGHVKDEPTEWSSHIVEGTEKKYFIPATTLKGCFRSVLEILSFSKMCRYNDDFFGYRSFTTQVSSTYASKMKNVKNCGWLYLENGKYYIMECTKGIVKIPHFILEKIFHDFVKGEDHKTAEVKQTSIGTSDSPFPEIEIESSKVKGSIHIECTIVHSGEKIEYSISEEKISSLKEQSKEMASLIKKIESLLSGKYKVVCTGYMNGKKVEYLFSDETRSAKEVDDEVIRKFKTVHKYTPYFAGEKGKKGFLQEMLSRGEKIPVFIEKDKGKINNIGITRMFRYPYNFSVKDQVKKAQEKSEDSRLDLSEAIFGYAKSDDQLRGRIHFGHAFCTTTIKDGECSLMTGVFGQPRASYFPLYLKQENHRVLTYDSNIPIAGRKRYRIVKGFNTVKLSEGNGNEKTMTSFRPLPARKAFVGKIRVHNLRKVEIGALLSAITFHGNSAQGVYHNLGLAKAYGYGIVKCTISRLNGLKYSVEEYLRAFEDEIVSYIRKEYNDESFSIQEDKAIQMLVKIAESTHLKNDMEHMGLGEFEQYKESRNFSQLEEPSEIKLKSMEEVKSDYVKQRAYSILEELRDVPSPKNIDNPDFIKEQITKWESVKEVLENNGLPTTAVESMLTQLKERLFILENPTTFNVGDTVKAKCFAPKKVRIDGYDYDIQLVIPKWDADKIVGKEINAIIKQISKAGKIVQLEYIG